MIQIFDAPYLILSVHCEHSIQGLRQKAIRTGEAASAENAF